MITDSPPKGGGGIKRKENGSAPLPTHSHKLRHNCRQAQGELAARTRWFLTGRGRFSMHNHPDLKTASLCGNPGKQSSSKNNQGSFLPTSSLSPRQRHNRGEGLPRRSSNKAQIPSAAKGSSCNTDPAAAASRPQSAHGCMLRGKRLSLPL